jgi:hypothetical protein
MKPTIRKVPSCSSPIANDAPIARPLSEVVQPDADSDEQRERQAGRGAALRQPAGERSHPEEAEHDPEQDEPRAAERRG